MKNKIKNILTSVLVSTFAYSCVANRPNQAYDPSVLPNAGRTDIRSIANLNLTNLYALLLSPTNNQLSLLDLADNRVKLSVNTGRNPQVLAVSPNKSHILVGNQLDGTISSFFREDNFVIRDLGVIGSGGLASDIIFNSNGTEAYAANQNLGRLSVLSILNRDRPKVKKVLSIKVDDVSSPLASPSKLALSSDNNTIYALDKNNGRLFIFTKKDNSFVQDITVNLNTQVRVVPEDIMFSNDKLYITDSNNSSIIVFDTIEKKVSNTISISDNTYKDSLIPTKMAFNSKEGKIYVINQGISTVAVIDSNKNSLVKHISLSNNSVNDAGEPSDISISDNGAFLYVTNNVGRNLSIISGKEDKLLRNIGTTMSAGALLPLSAINII
ncbi:MAG: YncE family protein [Candidatus Sericytochromatia bacterium]